MPPRRDQGHRAEQARAGTCLADGSRVALGGRDRLSELLADEPREVLDHALLATGDPIAAVQEQDHSPPPEPSGSAGACPRPAPIGSCVPLPEPRLSFLVDFPSVVIPTRERLGYLEVALESIAGQVAEQGGEIVIVDDGGPSARARELAERFGARYVGPTSAPVA